MSPSIRTRLERLSKAASQKREQIKDQPDIYRVGELEFFTGGETFIEIALGNQSLGDLPREIDLTDEELETETIE